MSNQNHATELVFDIEHGMDRETWIEHGLSVSFDGYNWTLCSRTSPARSRIISEFAARCLSSIWARWVKDEREQEELELRQEYGCQ